MDGFEARAGAPEAEGKAETTGSGRTEAAHLADAPDGCGCAEVWEQFSERRVGDD